eukprot:m.122147 g.122147  ORF g.122147 m.122147 type:complete len:217 (+) comp13410_c0_seq1:40-690(+)
MAAWGRLLMAVDHSDAGEVERILQSVADLPIGMTTKWGNTALHRAAKVGNLDSLILILNAGGNVSAVNDNGWTPLHDAAYAGNAACAGALTAAGADPKAKNVDNASPLDLATRRGNTAVLEAICQGIERERRKKRQSQFDQKVLRQKAAAVPKVKRYWHVVSEFTSHSNGTSVVQVHLQNPNEKPPARGFTGRRSRTPKMFAIVQKTRLRSNAIRA